jgi:hypothetical protein
MYVVYNSDTIEFPSKIKSLSLKYQQCISKTDLGISVCDIKLRGQTSTVPNTHPPSEISCPMKFEIPAWKLLRTLPNVHEDIRK